MEFGLNGWVDPSVVAHKLGLPLDVVDAWLMAAPNYSPLEKPDVKGFVQKVKMPK
jgi:hypothetical protein